MSSGNAELRSAAALLPRVVARSLADSSWQCYTGVWRRFQEWCQRAGVAPLPARPTTVACFLIRTVQASTSFSNVKTARVAIRKFHEAAGRSTPTEHELVLEVGLYGTVMVTVLYGTVMVR